MQVDYAARARALVGAPFRLQGRGVGGFDCIGVAIAVYGIDPSSVPHDYRLRDNKLAEVRSRLKAGFRRVSSAQIRSGDLMLMEAAADQLHLGIRTERGFVHAHAGVRKVVETPGMPPWPMIGLFRKRQKG